MHYAINIIRQKEVCIHAANDKALKLFVALDIKSGMSVILKSNF